MNYKWKGFDFVPQGCLLQQVIEDSPQMGFAYERSCQFYKDFHQHDRPIYIFPRTTCIMDVHTKNPSSVYKITKYNFLSIPETIEHDDEGISSIYDTFALLPERSYIHSIATENGFKKSEVKSYLSKCVVLKRSPYLNYLLDEYFFSRVIEKRLDAKTEFLEKNIILEILNLALNREIKKPIEILNVEDKAFVRALKYIETNLFSDLAIKKVAQEAGLGQATLFREFKKHLNATPYVYIQARRLEEAKILLESGNTSVGEVAVLVGYNNFGAFTDAFKKKYKKTPSIFLNKK